MTNPKIYGFAHSRVTKPPSGGAFSGAKAYLTWNPSGYIGPGTMNAPFDTILEDSAGIASLPTGLTITPDTAGWWLVISIATLVAGDPGGGTVVLAGGTGAVVNGASPVNWVFNQFQLPQPDGAASFITIYDTTIVQVAAGDVLSQSISDGTVGGSGQHGLSVGGMIALRISS